MMGATGAAARNDAAPARRASYDGARAPHPRENPPGYPAGWEADVVLSDGGLARLRPIRPADADLLVDFYGRVSDESKYLRFFAPYPRLSERDVERFTTVDYVDRVAFILTVADQMIGVGRYERLEDDRAEVAFLVEDAHQGRGVGQLLLEHLAEAARERGITGFVAEVLPENARMAQVFADAGYRLTRQYEDGLLVVEFPILPSDTSVGVMERREHRAEGESIRRMLNPQRVVVVGDGVRAQAIVTAMLSGGFRGEVVAVSTDDVEVSGVPTSPSLATVDGRFDLVVASIPRDDLGAAVIDAAHKGAHAIVVLTGADIGIADSARVVSLARAYGIRALGPDALGLINTSPEVALNASPGPMPRVGGVGLFCQSAAVGVALLAPALRQQIGISSFISTGEYADVSGNDVMQYWEDDDQTRICLLSLDSLGNPRKFTRIIRRLARRKPVVVVSPGRARRASRPDDHGQTYAPDAAVDALFRQSGVIVTDRRDEMFGIAQVAARQPLPAGPRTKLIMNSETLAHQSSHTVAASGLILAGDPVVLGPGQPPERLAELVAEALRDDGCDAVICAVIGVFGSDPQAARWRLDELAATTTKPLLAAFLDFTEFDESEDGPDAGQSLPIFEGPADAIHALAAVSAYAHWRERDQEPFRSWRTSTRPQRTRWSTRRSPETRWAGGSPTTMRRRCWRRTGSSWSGSAGWTRWTRRWPPGRRTAGMSCSRRPTSGSGAGRTWPASSAAWTARTRCDGRGWISPCWPVNWAWRLKRVWRRRLRWCSRWCRPAYRCGSPPTRTSPSARSSSSVWPASPAICSATRHSGCRR
ncbi:hypothetical protein GCM10027613_39720 [Microlunatus endophyticus]